MSNMKFEQADANNTAVVISVNPKSGSGDRSAVVRKLQTELESSGYSVEVLGDVDQVRQLATDLMEQNRLRTVVSAGGDGTASLLVNGLPVGTPLTILPLGTANLLANFLGMRTDAVQVADVIRSGKSVLFDVGRANGKVFTVVASCGFDAAVVESLHKHRKGHINYWTYSIPILKSIWRYKYPELKITADGKLIPHSRWAFVLNVPRYAMNLNFVEDADPSDGCLDVCTFKKGGLLRGLYYLFAVVLRLHQRIRATNFVRFKSLTIESDERVPFELDGDPGGDLPLTIEAVPEGMRLLVSEAWLREKSG